MRINERCRVLASVSEEPGLLVRPFGGPAMKRANALVERWMVEAGLRVRTDAVGNLIGRRQGTRPATGTLLLGSHLDTVRDAGAFDGALGVLVAVDALARYDDPLPFSVDVYAFADEEGLRFGSTYLGSRAVAGTFPPELLTARDADGITFADALRDFGGDPDAIDTASRRGQRLLGYVEVHMEQGPVLEAADEPLGVVTAIAGGTRARVTFRGEAGHAGTVPMDGRRDALAAAAEWVLVVERVRQDSPAQDADGVTPALVATVGEFAPLPGVPTVIAGTVNTSVDVRHPDDAVRRAAVAEIEAAAHEIADRRGVALDWRVVHDAPATPMHRALTAALARAIRPTAVVPRLVSGAGHDAVAMAQLCPAGMLFVRCAGGISHSPAESVDRVDAELAASALGSLLDEVATWT